MRVKIYQINPERDSNRMKFMSLSDSQSPDPSIYDEVFYSMRKSMKINLKKSTVDSTPWDIRCSEVIRCRYPMWW